MRTGRPLRVLVATAGTLGDLLPFVALGRRLTSRGHEVTIACGTGLHPWVERSGLKAAPFDGDFGPEMAQKHAREWDQWAELDEQQSARSTAEWDARLAAMAARFERDSRSLAARAREADLLLTPSNCPEGRLAHELSGAPWRSVIFIPSEGLSDPSQTGPESSEDDAGTCAAGATASPADGEESAFSRFMAPLRARLGLPPTACTSWEDFNRSSPALFACSAAFGRPTRADVLQTGFWFYDDPAWADWRPGAELARFMDGERAPLVLSFSSLPLADPRRVLEIHARAARLLGRRLVVQQGWAGFTREMLPPDVDPAGVYMASFIPHDWFLPRAAGLITHGGVGTLGRAVRSQCPLLVEPYGNDQFFNALLVKRLGFGAVMHPHQLSAESLAEVLKRRVLTPPSPNVRERLAAAASIIEREDGLGAACALIEAEQFRGARGAA